MRGPHQGAGLRVLVHNHNDVPLVRDYGLAVSPGSQAFVAVKVVEVCLYFSILLKQSCQSGITLTLSHSRKRQSFRKYSDNNILLKLWIAEHCIG